ncbi:MAG: hypothetical protein ACOCX4_05570, partial [Planctomycetota bacterium]
SDPAVPVGEYLGVIDGAAAIPLPHPDEGVPWSAPLVISLQRVEYLNRNGVEDLANLFGERPFVLCETPELFLLLLREMGVDVMTPVAETRDEARRLARQLRTAFAEVAAPPPESAEPVAPRPHAPARPPAKLGVAMRREGGRALVELTGELVPSTALAHGQELRAFFADGPWDAVVVDLSTLAYCALDGLVLLGDLPPETEVHLVATAPVRRQLCLLGFQEKYPIHNTRTLALAATENPYVAVAGREVYHRPECRMLRGTPVDRRIRVARSGGAGLRPCGICRPDTPASTDG